MDKKERLRELTDYFVSIQGIKEEFKDKFIFELNGWEGLLIYSPDGTFYQMTYKNPFTWNVSRFPDDIYGRKTFTDNLRWEDKVDSNWPYSYAG